MAHGNFWKDLVRFCAFRGVAEILDRILDIWK